LQKVQSVLQKFGLSSLADDVELKLNRAAETAAPKTKDLIWKAISEMTLQDAKKFSMDSMTLPPRISNALRRMTWPVSSDPLLIRP